jgi:hypothetical protein
VARQTRTGQDSQENTARTVVSGQERQDRTARIGQPTKRGLVGQDSQDGTA